MSALGHKSEALAHLRRVGGENARDWRAKVAVARGAAAHSGIFLYCNWYYCGTLQLDVLGPALYDIRKPDWEEGVDIPLTWGNVLAAIDMTYHRTVPPWGPWICHDFTAYILNGWGVKVDLGKRSATASGLLYLGGRALGTVLWPGPFAVAAVRRIWSMRSEGARYFHEAMSKLTMGSPSQWHWGF